MRLLGGLRAAQAASRRLTVSARPATVLSVPATVDAVMDEYIRRYSERDLDGVTELCLAPFLAIREGVPIHMPDRDAVRDHFAAMIDAYRGGGVATWKRIETTSASSASMPSSQPCAGTRSIRRGTCSETPGRRTTCSRLPTGGVFSRTRITSERSNLPPLALLDPQVARELRCLPFTPKADVRDCFVEAVTPIRLSFLVNELRHLLDQLPESAAFLHCCRHRVL